ncbi:MAG: AbrB/MazE/SpoVT family DNA-binding domain-containing protein [Armatimonadota bacterium]
MLTKKLARHGNSRALVIERPILDLLGIDDNTTLQLHTDGESLILTPITTEERSAAIRAAGRKFAKKYPRAMRVLAGQEDA